MSPVGLFHGPISQSAFSIFPLPSPQIFSLSSLYSLFVSRPTSVILYLNNCEIASCLSASHFSLFNH